MGVETVLASTGPDAVIPYVSKVSKKCRKPFLQETSVITFADMEATKESLFDYISKRAMGRICKYKKTIL